MKTRRINSNKPSLASSTATSEGQKENLQLKKPDFKKNVSQVEGKVLLDAASAHLKPSHDLQVPYIPATAKEETQLLKANPSPSFGNLNAFLPASLSNAIQERGENQGSAANNNKTEEPEQQQSNQHSSDESYNGNDVVQETPADNQQHPEPSDDMEELLRLSDEEFQQRKAMLVEHFRTGMQYYSQKWEALVEREQEVVQQTVDYVLHLKKTHRFISHGPYEE